jgi:hypothetical protein
MSVHMESFRRDNYNDLQYMLGGHNRRHAHAIENSVNDSWHSINPYLIEDVLLQTKESVESSCTIMLSLH